MSIEVTPKAPTTMPTEIDVLTHVKPVSAPVEVIEAPKTLEEYAKVISEMNRICEEADKQSKLKGKEAIAAAIKTGELLIEVKATGEIPHGQWEKWCKARGVKKPIYLRRMKIAESKVTHGSLLESCNSLRQAEICCGARSDEKQDRPPETQDNNSSTDEEIKVVPELILNDVRNKFEYIQRQYNILTNFDPELNSFLLGKGYSNDFPLLLQQWQSSLSDIFAYFGLEPISNVCVRCGHVREWNELFVPISAYYPYQHLQQFNLWCQQCESAYDYDFEKKTWTQKHVIEDLPKAIEELKGNLDELKLLPVKEYTLKQKWYQLTCEKNVATSKQIAEMESRIWTPTDINNEESTIQEIQAIQPKLVIVPLANKKANDEWNIFKHFISTAVNYDIPARYIKFLVKDANKNNSVIGIGAIASDFIALGVRDKWIGWTTEQRTEKNGKNRNTAIASTVVATQPFGFNFNGAKLIAALVTSQPIREAWKERYGDTLVGMTTTSLYGYKQGSFYNSIREWKPLGLSTGKVPIQPKLELWYQWKQFLKETRAYELGMVLTNKDNKGVSNPKAKEITLMFKAAGLRLGDYTHNHKRGVYFSEFYENTKDFLCGKIPEGELKMKPLFQETVEQITDRWRKKAIKRYLEQKQKGELKPEKQSFGQLGKMDFEAAQKTFLDVDEVSVDDTAGDVAAQLFFCKIFEHQTEGWVWQSMLR